MRGKLLPRLFFFTDPIRTPDPARILTRLPRGAGVVYRAFGAADAVAQGVDPATPAAIVDNGARAGQRVVTGTLASIAAEAREAALRGPTIIIVGSVVTLRDRLAWRG